MNTNPKFFWQVLIAAFLLGSLVSALTIYLTPLKNLNIVEPTIKDIDPKVFYEEFRKDSNKFLFVDVRYPTDYFAEHAEGAINIPINLLYTEKNTLPKTGKTIVLICTGGALSGVAYGYLEHFGFTNLRRIEGGITAWRALGLPVVTQSWYSYKEKQASFKGQTGAMAVIYPCIT